MKETIDLIVCNPAGNTTILVLSPAPISCYQEITDAVLDINFKDGYGIQFTEGNYDKEIKGEQVAFMLPDADDGTGRMLPAMNMCGLEFCGNASRSFAYYRAFNANPPLKEITVKVSGCDYPLVAEIDSANKDAKIQMPLPHEAARFTAEQLGLADRYPDMTEAILVDMDGISHLVLKDVEPSPELFEELKGLFYPASMKVDGASETDGALIGDFPAMGVMFIDTKTDIMTPVVYVHDVDTTYFEGSCASGTTAASFVLAMDLPDGTHKLTFRQPAGTLYTEVQKESGQIKEIKLNGLVELSDIITVEI